MNVVWVCDGVILMTNKSFDLEFELAYLSMFFSRIGVSAKRVSPYL